MNRSNCYCSMATGCYNYVVDVDVDVDVDVYKEIVEHSHPDRMSLLHHTRLV